MSELSNVVCIAGMHRSGTSLLANWFHSSGIIMGQEFLGAASSNPKGHYEDLEFLELHQKDLESKSLHRTGLFVNESAYRLNQHNQKIAEGLIIKRNGYGYWGWKEPRSVLYLEHWKYLIPQLKVVMVFREPSLVVRSLYARLTKNKWYKSNNPFKRLWWYIDIDLKPRKWIKKFEKCYNLYNEGLLNYYGNHTTDTLLVDINDLLKHPKTTGGLIEEFLGGSVKMIDIRTIYDSKLMHVPKSSRDLELSDRTLRNYNKLKLLHAGTKN